MKIVIPTKQEEINLGSYQNYIGSLNKDMSDNELIDSILIHIIGIDENEVKLISQSDREDIYKQVATALFEKGEFKQRFYLNGVEFGLIPNFTKDKVTGVEYGDICLYNGEDKTLHNLMAILYRPVTSKDKHGNYQIVPYMGTSEYAEYMKQMPLSYVKGVMGFFLNLSHELQVHIQKYLQEE